MNSYSDRPRTSSRRCVRTASVQTHARSRTRQRAEGQLVSAAGRHVERIWAIAPDVLQPLLWVGARQAAQREQPRHEPEIGLRFAGLDELIDLVQCGEVVSCLERGRPGGQAVTTGPLDRPGDVAEGNKSVSFLLFVFTHRSSRCDHRPRPSGQRHALGRPTRGGTPHRPCGPAAICSTSTPRATPCRTAILDLEAITDTVQFLATIGPPALIVLNAVFTHVHELLRIHISFLRYPTFGVPVAIIAMIQQKGGVGKSTISANLAGELLRFGRSVAVVDLDPQRSLANWAKLGNGLLSEWVEAVNITSPAAFQAKISAATQQAERVILDCPPGLPDTGLMAALLADLVILPVTPSPLDIIAGQEAMAMMREARVKRNNTKPLIRFAPARVSVNTLLSRDLTAALERLGEPVLPSTHQRVGVAEAVIHGLTVGEYAPESKAHEEFKQLAVAVERIVKQ